MQSRFLLVLSCLLNVPVLCETKKQPNFLLINNNQHIFNNYAVNPRENNNHKQFRKISPVKEIFDSDLDETIPTSNLPTIESNQTALVNSWLPTLPAYALSTYIAGGVICVYSYIVSKLLFSSYYINKNDTWSCWRQNHSLETLNANEQKTAQDLFSSLNQRYKACTRDFLSPLAYFINDIDSEAAFLHSFITLHNWLNYLKIKSLFPGQVTLKVKAIEKIKRLAYLKQLMVNWAGEYKVSCGHVEST